MDLPYNQAIMPSRHHEATNKKASARHGLHPLGLTHYSFMDIQTLKAFTMLLLPSRT